MLQAYSITVNLSSVFALMIGIFIINSFAIGVTQRRAGIGVLRALGATRGQIRPLFLGESTVAGVIGSATGVTAGQLLAHVVTTGAARLTEEVYGVVQNIEQVSLAPGSLAAISVACFLFGRAAWVVYGGYLLMAPAVVLLVPTMALWLALGRGGGRASLTRTPWAGTGAPRFPSA